MKYHVGKAGNPAQCTATKRACPLGEDTPHFETKDETLKYIEESAKKENKTFNEIKK